MSTDLYEGRVHTPPNPTAPCVFAFHGTGGDEHQFFDFARQMLPEAGVVSPRGDVSEFGAARFFKRTGEGVYDMADLTRAVDKMARYVAAHKAARPDAPTYGFGYSNGANILAAVVMEHPELFDRVALLHPLIPWEPAPAPALKGTPVLVTAGERDPITPYAESQRLMAWFEAQGAEVETHVHPGGHELRPAEAEALAKLLTA